jgi:hypothetical protein
VTGPIEDRLDVLESRAAEVEERVTELGVLSDIVLLVHECIIDLADAIEELGGQIPDGLSGRLERLEQLTNSIL